MLKFGIKIITTKEVFEQITRLDFGGVKSFVGKVPIENTGGANVPPVKPMEIPNNLQAILSKSIEVDRANLRKQVGFFL